MTILRDAMLRIAPQDEVVGFGVIPKLHLGNYAAFFAHGHYPAGAISESVLSNFKVLRRHFRVVPLFSPWPPRFCLCGFSG
jgi:hypothetical protein